MQPHAPSIPAALPPLRSLPKLIAKPFLAPPPPKKPITLNDVGTAPKPPVIDEESGAGKPKER